MDKETILRKIKHCLALSKSDNVNEAATALRQAQKLMEIYGVNESDVEFSDVSESLASGNGALNPAKHEVMLVNIVSAAFACKHIYTNEYSAKPKWSFIGISPADEIAKYTFTVLFRKLKASREKYVKEKLFRCGPANKIKRADLFCDAWVYQIRTTVMAFTGQTKEQAALIKSYFDKKYPDTKDLQPKNRNSNIKANARSLQDALAGRTAAEGVQLNHAVNMQSNSIELLGQ